MSQKQKEDDELLTLAKAAKIAKRNPATLRFAVKQGNLKATLYGKTYLVSRADLDAWIKDGKHKPGPVKKS